MRLWLSAAKEQAADPLVDPPVDPLDDETDDWPTVQRHRQAGTWKIIHGKNAKNPNPFSGLMK
jgi:hypothetical protein